MALTDAVVLAAGEGRRLRPLTGNRPKPMLHAAHRPILEYVLDALLDAGIERLVVVVGYRRDRVQSHFGPTYREVPIEYAIQRKQLGSGHALQAARSTILGDGSSSDEGFLVVNGDQLYASSLIESVADRTADSEAAGVLGVLRSDRATDYGAVRMRDDHVTEIVERPVEEGYHLLNAGVYGFQPSIFDGIETTPRREGELSLPDVLSRMLAAGTTIDGVVSEGLWEDATYPWDLLRLTETLLEAGAVDRDAEAVSPGIWVDPSATVHDRAALQAPVVIGPDTEVGPLAVVGPVTALGRNVTVGAGSIVQRSTIDDDTRIGPGATLEACVTGQGVRIGAASTVTGGPADVRVGDRIFADRTLGAVFADRVRLGGDVSVAPGTLVGPAAHLRTGVSADGVIEADTVVTR